MDNAASVAFDPRSPSDERYDATSEIQKAHMPRSIADLMIKPDEMAPVIEMIRNDLADQAMEKALAGGKNIIPFPSSAAKNKAPGMQSVWLNDTQIQVMGDWYERPSNFTFDMMRSMVAQTPVLNSVIMTRQRQIQRFCRPQDSGRGPGFKIALKDMNVHAGTAEKQSMQELQSFFTNSGWEANPRARRRLKRDDFSSFMGKLVRETLTMDSMPIETEWKRDRSLGLDGMYAVDGSTIRLCTEQGYHGDDEIYALQVLDGNIRAAYTYDDLIYIPRNPVADVLNGGYGLSETELLIRVVTGFLNAFTYNTKYFDSNQIPKGMLHLSGSFGTDDLAAFRRQWGAMVKGVNNSWNLPVMVSKDGESKASFENFGVDVDEMMFGRWISFLVSMICAVYGMAPDEINFESFTVGGSGLKGNDTEEKLINSKDKGLRPLLSYYENLFSDYVVAEYGDKYVFRWTGLDDEDPSAIDARLEKGMTWNEWRARDDLPKIDGAIGDAPLNSVLTGAWMQQSMPQEAESASSSKEGDAGGKDKKPAQRKPQDLGKAFGLPVLQIDV